MNPGTATSSDLPRRLRRHLDRSRLLEPGQAVVVALSGGLDSAVLLHLLRFPLRARVAALAAAHLDHAMRPGSRADADWVAGLCRAWDVPLTRRRADPPPRSEAAARAARYEFLEAAAGTGPRIVTAHHARDQAETVLFRLARGTGLRGLRGIAPARGRFVRPLLPFAPDELEAYAASVGLRFRTDPTNLDPRFARNRIRHRVLPELERAHPGAVRAIARLADQARAAEAAWDDLVDDVQSRAVVAGHAHGVTLARDTLLAYHPALRARLLRRLLRRYGVVPSRAGTHAALEFITSGPSGRSLDLGRGARLERDFDRLRLVAAAGDADGPADLPLEISGPEPGSGRFVVGGRARFARWGTSPIGGADEAVTLEEPRFPLALRPWRPGDRIRLGYGTKKLKKLLAERRVGRRERASVPVLVDGRGVVLWVVGFARAEGVAGAGKGFQIAVRDA